MITRKLKCQLTDDDILDRGRALAKAEHDYQAIEAEKSAVNKDFKNQLTAVASRIDLLANAIRDKEEERDVPCLIEDNPARMVKQVIRTDTHQVVEEYSMTEAERQGTLL